MLHATTTRRFSHGLRFLFSYTFSKSIDDGSGGATSIFAEVTGDESNMSSSKGVSDFDRTHRAVANFGYEIPKFGFGFNNTALPKPLFPPSEIAPTPPLQ